MSDVTIIVDRNQKLISKSNYKMEGATKIHKRAYLIHKEDVVPSSPKMYSKNSKKLFVCDFSPYELKAYLMKEKYKCHGEDFQEWFFDDITTDVKPVFAKHHEELSGPLKFSRVLYNKNDEMLFLWTEGANIKGDSTLTILKAGSQMIAQPKPQLSVQSNNWKNKPGSNVLPAIEKGVYDLASNTVTSLNHNLQ